MNSLEGKLDRSQRRKKKITFILHRSGGDGKWEGGKGGERGKEGGQKIKKGSLAVVGQRALLLLIYIAENNSSDGDKWGKTERKRVNFSFLK